jgi:ribosomal protein S8
LRVKKLYKIQNQTLAYAVFLSERLYPEIVAKIKKEGFLRGMTASEASHTSQDQGIPLKWFFEG